MNLNKTNSIIANYNGLINFKKKNFLPEYSTKKAKIKFDKILKKIIKKKNFKQHFFISGYNIISVALEDLFWQYCFQYQKYNNFIKMNGLDLNVHHIHGYKHIKDNGYQRVKNYLNGNNYFKTKIKLATKLILFYLWILISLFTKKKATWIDKRFYEDMRYQNLKLNIKNYLIIPFSFDQIKTKTLNHENAFIKDAHQKINSYKLWMIALKLLKPNKIYLTDNPFNNYSILLAAKILNIRCEGICHAVNIKNHMNIMGTKYLPKNKLLLFDKIHVYSEDFKNFVSNKGYFYNSKKINVVGWINNRNYSYKMKKNKQNKYVIYPFEHFCNFQLMNKVLRYFSNKDHIIIIKKRPDMQKYDFFDKDIKIKYVNDFTTNHIKNCICAIGTTTSLIFNLSQNYIPILYLTKNGFDYFEGFKSPSNWIKSPNINRKIYNKLKNYKIKNIYSLTKVKTLY